MASHRADADFCQWGVPTIRCIFGGESYQKDFCVLRSVLGPPSCRIPSWI